MKKIFLSNFLLLLFLNFKSTSQSKTSSYVYDLSTKQIEFYEKNKNLDSAKFAQKLVKTEFFKNDTITNFNFLNKNYKVNPNINFKEYFKISYNNKNNVDGIKHLYNKIGGIGLKTDFEKIIKIFEKKTELNFEINTFIFLGPQQYDMYNFKNGTLIFDITNFFRITDNYSENRKILINRFIYEYCLTFYMKSRESNKIDLFNLGIIEGICIEIQKEYWKEKFNLLKALNYTKEEYLECEKREREILDGFNLDSSIDLTKNENKMIHWKYDKQKSGKLPSGIIKFIGLKIIEKNKKELKEYSSIWMSDYFHFGFHSLP